MPRTRAYRNTGRYSRRVKTIKYSNETYNFCSTLTKTDLDNGGVVYLIPPISQQGTRKCKNFTLSVKCTQLGSEVSQNTSFGTQYFALVYVPQGTEASNLEFGSKVENVLVSRSLYEPNQNVILSGCISANGLVNIYRSRLARNLNSGDGIAIVVRNQHFVDEVTSLDLSINLNYAVSF